MHPNPTLYCDFTKNSQPIQAGITIAYSGGANGTRFNENGLIVAASAPRIDYDPTSIRLLNGARSSERFSAWGSTGMTVTPNAIGAPQGTGLADLILESSSNSEHYIEQAITGTGISVAGVWTQSFFVKPSFGRTAIRFIVVHVGQAPTTSEFVVDFSTDPPGFIRATGLITNANVTAAGNGWYRISCNVTVDNTVTSLRARIGCEAVISTAIYPGDPTKGFYLYGAQFEAGSALSKYTPCDLTNVFSPATPIGLLVEEARTNLALRSQELDNAAWTKVGCTISANATTAPDGTLTADKFIPDNLAAGSGTRINQSFTATASQKQAVSFWAKAAEFRDINLTLQGAWAVVENGNCNFDLVTGVVGNSGTLIGSMVAYPNGWWRCSAIFTSTGAPGTPGPQIQGGVTTVGNGTSGVYIWGIQIEDVAAVISSYIPTLGTAVSRTSDHPTIPKGSWWNSNSGTWVIQYIPTVLDGSPRRYLLNGTDGGLNRYAIRSAEISVVPQAVFGNGAINNSLAVAAHDLNQLNTFAVCYDFVSGDVAFNGVNGAPTVTGYVDAAAFASIFLGWNGAGDGAELLGKIVKLAFYPFRMNGSALNTLSRRNN